MNSEAAREYFKDAGLDYSVLDPYTLDLLTHTLQGEILKMRSKDDSCVLRTVRWHGFKQDKCAFLTVDGTYFKNRETISFNRDGFIGFAGWASSKNVKPIIDGFVEWCDLLVVKMEVK